MRLKHPVRRPGLCLLFSLPLLAVLGHDLFIWQTVGQGFHFSETGYLLQHYTPFHNTIANAFDSDLWRKFLSVLFHTKAVLLTGAIAGIAIILLNRRQHMQQAPTYARVRR